MDETIIMTDMLIKSQANLMQQAQEALSESNQLLETFATEWQQSSDHPLDDIENIRTIQLILQYRLDTQNALSKLSSLQQYLLQLLGIEPLHSLEVNIERMGYALGSDDLHQILAMLNQLVDALLRILAHHMQHQILDRKKAMERLKNLKHIDIMVKVMEKQKTFVAKMEQLKLALEDVGGAPHPGIIYDHISALEGPISRFYQALQNGLILSGGLYQQMHLQPHLEYQLADTLQKTDQMLQNLDLHHENQRLFTPSLENTDPQRLEERASAKRLGNFFNH